MHYDAPNRSRTPGDPALRELLVFLRDTCREVAVRIDRYLGTPEGPVRGDRLERVERVERVERNDRFDRTERSDRGERRAPREEYPPPYNAESDVLPNELERLREEARALSSAAARMDPGELRLRIEAVTAETRALQMRADDPEDREQAARILRVLTAVVSEHRPGHVYGLARHHQTDWDEMARRARETLARGPLPHEDPVGD